MVLIKSCEVRHLQLRLLIHKLPLATIEEIMYICNNLIDKYSGIF